MKKRNYRAKGFRPDASPHIMKAMQELRRSSAASPHVPRPFKGTRGNRNRRAIQDQMSD